MDSKPEKMSNEAKEAHTMMKMTEMEKKRSGSEWNSRTEDHKEGDETEMKTKARAKEEEMATATDITSMVASSWSEGGSGGNWEARRSSGDAEETMKRSENDTE